MILKPCDREVPFKHRQVYAAAHSYTSPQSNIHLPAGAPSFYDYDLFFPRERCHGADLELGKRTYYCTKRGRGSSAALGGYIYSVSGGPRVGAGSAATQRCLVP